MITNVLLATALLTTNNVTAAENAFTHPMPPGTTVVIEAPAFAWFIRPIARNLNNVLAGGLTFKYEPGIDCDDYPDDVCINVEIDDAPEEYGAYWWPAVFDDDGTAIYHEIRFNSKYSGAPRYWKRSVSCHELMHAIGFDHFDGAGCLDAEGNSISPKVSPAALKVLSNHYLEK